MGFQGHRNLLGSLETDNGVSCKDRDEIRVEKLSCNVTEVKLEGMRRTLLFPTHSKQIHLKSARNLLEIKIGGSPAKFGLIPTRF